MIPLEDRFWSEGQNHLGDGINAYCNVWDWDQLRMIKIKGTPKVFPIDKDKEVAILAQFADYLSPEVRAVEVDNDGLICGVSTDPEEDETVFIAYPPYSTIESLAGCRTIKHSQLQELDRLAPFVDLSSYKDENQNTRMVAFKFNVLEKPLRVRMAWNEINLLRSLPPHPNIVPFDSVVLEDVESRVIGFTTKYIPGGSLSNPKTPFRFEWLKQLTEVVDFLNLNLGIMHQDIAPRNLMIDPDTQKLLLFDFDRAACGKVWLMDNRDDVSGVVYAVHELITNDSYFTGIPHWERHMDMVQNIPEWVCNRELDADVSVFREFLDEWVRKRQSGGIMEQYLKAPNRPTWPEEPPSVSDYDVPWQFGKTMDGEPMYRPGVRLRRIAMELGQYCFRWERPPQSILSKKSREENADGIDQKAHNDD
ncbi:uncharacterized protein EAF02_001688 [Botrytis sinoallii]|uniref:uncharacterized protein n=1 Tax=Botrytis sinoallii TaxID=1463999 RepID=UPI00190070BE|nr:uncharacterized protein EAF02_001688 [Botrytis sinoallii]KAF7891363.1 hypothetical protein EAF02_001688 [Botrytis sinoallii]